MPRDFDNYVRISVEVGNMLFPVRIRQEDVHCRLVLRKSTPQAVCLPNCLHMDLGMGQPDR